MMSKYRIGAQEGHVQGIVVRNRRKWVLLGVGLLLLVVGLIIAMYATYRADADQSSNNVSTPDEVNTLDVNVESELMEPDNVTNSTEAEDPGSSSTQQGETNTTNSDVDVQVNGMPIDVPENGSVHKEITSEDGSTSIDVSSQSATSSGDSRTRSSINIDVDSSSRSRTEINE